MWLWLNLETLRYGAKWTCSLRGEVPHVRFYGQKSYCYSPLATESPYILDFNIFGCSFDLHVTVCTVSDIKIILHQLVI